MAVAFVGAGSGLAITTGSGTVSKTSCTAGNLLVVHLVVRGATEDWGGLTGEVNTQLLDGTVDQMQSVQTGLGVGTGSPSRQALFCGRVTANGTCSVDFTVGASGEDLFLRMYEFSGEATGSTVASVFENAAGTYDANEGTSVTVADIAVVTNGADRLACQFVGVAANQAVADFTGETGGNWVEAVAEFASATGALATLQLQTATIASAGTIDGGTQTITSADWGCIGTAIIPAPAGAGVMFPMGKMVVN